MSKTAIDNQAQLDHPISTSHPIEHKESRLLHLDALRGLIMILMAIDHASYFIAHQHPAEFWGLPLPQYQETLAFLTRLVTHICAPGFFFLMGIGMMLFAHSRRRSGSTENAIRKHFITRALLLIVIQLFIENPAWLLGPVNEMGLKPPGGGSSVFLHFGVLYCLGAVMIVCALLLRVNAVILASISILAVLITQVMIPAPDKVGELYSPLIRLLLIPGHTNIVQVFYPLIPWLGLSVFGLVFAKWILNNPTSTSRAATIIGASFLALFLLVRFNEGFGNIHPVDDSDWIGFLNVTKYPPSLAFILLTSGVNLLLLALFSRIGTIIKRWAKPLLVFGQTAFFFYIVHLYLYGVIGLAIAPSRGTTIAWMYLYWAGGLLLLYLLCVRYGDFKRRQAPDSVWRFF